MGVDEGAIADSFSCIVTVLDVYQYKVKCDRTFTDKMTGRKFARPEFLRMLDIARRGDIIVVWRLDRLGRNLKELIETVTQLAERGIESGTLPSIRRRPLDLPLLSIRPTKLQLLFHRLQLILYILLSRNLL